MIEVLSRGSVVAIVGVLILALSACAILDGDASELEDTRWRLESYGDPGSQTPVMEDTEVTLHFESGEQAGGSGGCNSFGARYQVSDGTISFSEIVSTEIYCTAEGVMEQERAYFEALRTADEFEVTDDQLRIRYGDGQGVLTFVRSEAS